MKTTTRFLQAATLIAITLIFSCSSDDSGGGNDPSNGSNVGISSSNGNSSSSAPSVTPSSSSSQCNQTGIIKGPSVIHGGETYESVVICDQTWLARNLNYEVEGSKCYGEDGRVSVDVELITISDSEIQANCDTYGRLYDWATAMALDKSCNKEECADQIQPKHRGICPSGWHIPSNEDWKKLWLFGGLTAGTKLKASNLWNSYSGVPAGTDDFGFSALPGGHGSPVGIGSEVFYIMFLGIGSHGFWWSSTEDYNHMAYGMAMYYDHESAGTGSLDKENLFSVRCVKD